MPPAPAPAPKPKTFQQDPLGYLGSLVPEAAVGLLSPYAMKAPVNSSFATSPVTRGPPVDTGPVNPVGQFLTEHSPQAAALSAVRSTRVGMESLYNFIAPHLGGQPINDPGLASEQQAQAEATQKLRDTLHAPEYDDIPHFLANVTGSLLTPSPGGPVFTAASDASKLEKFGTGLANTAAEFALPMRQGKLIPTLAAQLPISLGIKTGVDALVDSDTKKTLAAQGVQSPVTTGAPTAPTSSYQPKDVEDYLSPDERKGLQDSIASGDQESIDNIMNYGNAQRDADIRSHTASVAAFTHTGSATPGPGTPSAQPPVHEQWWQDPLKVAAALTVASIGAGTGTLLLKLAKERTTGGVLSGSPTLNTLTDAGTNITGKIVQADAPIRNANMFMTTGKKGVLAQTTLATRIENAKLDRLTANSQHSIITHASTTGAMPKSSVSMPIPLVTFLKAHAELTPAEQEVLRDGSLAATVLDDVKNSGGKLETFIPSFADRLAGKTDAERIAELQTLSDRLKNDPKLSVYYDKMKGIYRAGIDFAHDRGLISPDEHARLTTARPDYVHLYDATRVDDTPGAYLGSGNARPGSDIFDALLQREGGIQAGAAGDPVRGLSPYISGIIHKAEVNGYKLDFFDRATANTGMKEYIEAVGSQMAGPDIHTVYRDGVAEKFRVKDPLISDALNFAPAALPTNLVGLLGMPKRIAEAQITGNLSTFAPIAAAYSTLSTVMTRPKGYDLGLVNEWSNRVYGRSFLPEQLSSLDPTTWLASFTGGARIVGAKVIDGMAQDLMTRIETGAINGGDAFGGIAAPLFGGISHDAMAGRLAQMYQNTMYGTMESLGATHAGFLGANRDLDLATGMQSLAPEYHAQQQRALFSEARRGGASFPTQAAAFGRAMGSTVATAPVAKQVLQAVTLLNNAMHEGANLSGFATNYSKVKGNPELEQLLASQTRRLAGDLSQTGSSPAQQWLARTVMFENPALQGLSEIARKYKDQPITTLANMLTVLTVGTAVQYLTLANDPKARERYQNMTDQERARTIIVPGLAPGGVDVSVRPEYRLLWGPNTAIMDQVSGLNTGQIDTNWADALHTWATSGNSDLTNYSLGQRMDYAFDSVNPLNLTSSPWGNAAMSAAGFDSTMSRYTGDAKPFLPQRLDPALGDVENPGDIMSTRAMHVTQSLFGAQIEHVIRSMGAYNWVVHHDGSMMDGIKAAADSLAHDEVRSTGFMRQVLFGNTPEVQGINTPEDALWFKQEQGLKDAMTFLKEDVKNAGVAGGDPRYKYYRDIDYTKDEYLHTEGAVVGSIAAGLDRSLEPARKELADLNDQIRTNIPSKVHSTQDQKTLEINEKNVRRRALIDYMQHTAEGAAQQIRDTIGDPSFNWQNSDITKYGKIPWPPPPPPPQAPQAQAPTPVGAPQ